MIKKGFTLAEVLITIGIIGIIAAITIPTLLRNIDQLRYVSALKKSSSVLASALTLMAQENSGSITNSFIDVSDFKDKFSQNLKVLKNCDGTGLGECWPADTKYLNNSYINWNTFISGTDPSIVLQDGSALHFDDTFVDTNCKSTWNGESLVDNICLVIMVDVNGLKEPNTMGKDIYRFFVNERNTLVPFGAASTNAMYDPSTDCTSTGTGSGCTAFYILNNR